MSKTGRPFRDDEELLARMANTILRDPTMTRTAAFVAHYVWQAEHQSFEAECKRLVKKFGERSSELLAAARNCQHAAQNETTPIVIKIPRFVISPSLQAAIRRISTQHQQFQTRIGDVLKSVEIPNRRLIGNALKMQRQFEAQSLRIGSAVEAMQKSVRRFDIKPYQLPKGIETAIRLQKTMPRIVIKSI